MRGKRREDGRSDGLRYAQCATDERARRERTNERYRADFFEGEEITAIFPRYGRTGYEDQRARERRELGHRWKGMDLWGFGRKRFT
jgi:hypothetical protein